MTKLKPNQFYLAGHLITERPILFQTEMVQANMEDRKTQTRRTKGLDHVNDPEYQKSITLMKMGYNVDGDRSLQIFKNGDVLNHTFIKPPYGKPGDLLWVREASIYAENLFPPQNPQWVYKADYETSIGIRWKPSIHMPKSGARLWLMVEDIRVERVQDITETDAIAEGIKLSYVSNGVPAWIRYDGYAKTTTYPVVSFWSLWASINGEASWDTNPWVWVVQYRILSKTGRPSDDTILENYLQLTRKEATNG